MFNNELWQKPAGGAGGAGFYTHQIANSVRMVAPSSTSSSNARLTKTFSTVDSNVHFTLNFWIKRSAIEGRNPVGAARLLNVFTPRSGTSGSVLQEFGFAATGSYGGGDAFVITNTNTGAYILSTNNLFRDTSAWYNIHIQADLDNASASEKLKIFVNGTEASYNVDNRSSYTSLAGVVAGAWTIGDYYNYGYPIQSYLAQWCYIDGTTYAPTDFAEMSNGVWIPKDVTGLTFGSAGHLLMFQDSSALGDDTSGNTNDWTSSNLDTHDQMIDSPTFNSTSNGGNFMTYNGAWIGSNNALAEGNLKSTGSSGGNTSGTFGMLTGKWYWECRAETVNAYGPTFGIGQSGRGNTDGQYYVITWQTAAGQMYGGGGDPVGMGTITVTSTGITSLSSGDIMSFWLDCDNGKLWIGKNGAIPNSGDPASGSNPQASWSTIPTDRYFTATCQNVGSGVGVLNAGQNPSFNGAITAGTNTDKNGYGLFKYDPSGTDFIACCAANLSISAQIDPAQNSDDYPQKMFTALAYSGDNGGSQTTGFQPDWVWVKRRNSSQSNALFDSSRGVTKILISNETDVEGTTSGLTAFNSTGYTMGTFYNQTGNTYASWSWRANGGTTSTNTQGDTNSTVQVDPSGHFSIVLGTGDNDNWGNPQTFGHGLSAAPNCIIGKKRTDNADEWQIFFSDYGSYSIGGSNAASNSLVLNNDAALYTNQSYKGWGGVMPTSTVFTLDGNNLVGNGDTFVCYCFANCEGYIKSGTYVGNANADGTFVYTGFRPAFFMCKPLPAGAWRIQDDTRAPFNVANEVLYPNLDSAEDNYTSNDIDILSNGVKMRASDTTFNQATTYVYLAMAHNPFKYSLAR